jgi:hypothetical protein
MSATLDEAIEAGKQGGQRALDHAERDTPSWRHIATMFLRRYARQHPEFIIEEVVEAAAAWGMVEAPDARAWGPVIRAAARDRVIAKTDRARPAKSSRGSVKPVWRSLIYRGGVA